MYFDPLLIPDKFTQERPLFNLQQNNNLKTLLSIISSNSRDSLYSEYNFNIKPSTDNKPYFSQYLKLNKIAKLTDIYRTQSVPFFEAGYILTLLTLIQLSIIAFVLIIIPLVKLGWKRKGRLFTFLYFTGIGLGYMFIEIILIQKFIHYFGIPIYSAAIVIASMLICSGIGSLTSFKLISSKTHLKYFILAVICLILFYSQLLTVILEATIALSFSFKIIFAFFILAPLSYIMGMFFPTGVKILSSNKEYSIAWAWGINSFFSVIAAVLSTILAVELGFKVVFFSAALFYFVTFCAVVFFLKNSTFAIDN